MILKYKTDEHVFDENKEEGVLFLTYPLLTECDLVQHGFSTRIGGVSEGVYSSMNLSFGREDLPENVEENFHRISRVLNIKQSNMVFSHQTHTTNIKVVTAKDRGKGIKIPRDFENIDGMITNIPEVCLVTFYADCVPLFFVDPIKKVIGLTHSGWRGTVGKIGARTIQAMEHEFGSKPKDILAAIGPSICQDCYEVSEDVILEFKETFKKQEQGDLFYKKDNGKYQLNLWEANKKILMQAGINRKNLAVSNLCTCCNPNELFSHRASRGQRGNLAAFLSFKKEVTAK